MQNQSRTQANTINPLIGLTSTDTLDNLCICLECMGEAMSHHHKDPTLAFFMSSVRAALRFEAEQLEGLEAQAVGGETQAAGASSSARAR